MTAYLRLPLSAADFDRISNLEIDNLSDSNLAFPNQPHQHGMALWFQVQDPNDPPQVRPLGPGRLLFIYNPDQTKTLPKPTAEEIKAENYNKWPVKGWLQFRPDRTPNSELYKGGWWPEELGTVYVWYGPVKLTEDFLFQSVSSPSDTGLRKDPIRRTKEDGTSQEIKIDHTHWPYFAVSEFLKGNHPVTLQLNDQAGNTPALHDVVTKPMPKVVVDDNGQVLLHVIVTQVLTNPQDGTHEELDLYYHDLVLPSRNLPQQYATIAADETLGRYPSRDPFHPMYSPVPAGRFFYNLKGQFVELPTAGSIAYKGLFPSQAPAYTKLQFTRTWQKIPNESTYFPRQSLRITSEDSAVSVVLLEGKLPANGTVYLRQMESQFQKIKVALPSDLLRPGTYLAGEYEGGDEAPWKKRGATEPLEYDLSKTPEPHIIVRRPFWIEMMRETPPDVDASLCTYLSLRRFLLAFIDHRITGGRLLSLLTKGEDIDFQTKPLLDTVSPGLAEDVTKTLHLRTQRAIFPEEELRKAKNKVERDKIMERLTQDAIATHEPIMKKLFPTMVKSVDYPEGKIAFHLWHNGVKEIASNSEYYPKQHVGRGAPGAAVYLGLSRDYAFSPDGKSSVENTKLMTKTELWPGSLLQWYDNVADFENLTLHFDNSVNMQNWQDGKRDNNMIGSGHSLIFAGHQRDQTGRNIGIWVADYYYDYETYRKKFSWPQPPSQPVGLHYCRVKNDIIWWNGYTPKIWVAANWTEE